MFTAVIGRDDLLKYLCRTRSPCEPLHEGVREDAVARCLSHSDPYAGD